MRGDGRENRLLRKMLKGRNRTVIIVAASFVILLALFEWLIFSEYRSNSLADIVIIGGKTQSNRYLISSLTGYFFWLAMLFVFIYLSLISTLLLRGFYFLIFTLVCLHEYAYQSIFGRFSTSQDFALIFITTQAQKLAAVFSYVSIVAVLPCILYLILLLTINRAATLSFKKSLMALTFVIFLIFSLNLAVWLLTPKFFLLDTPLVSFGAADRSIFGYTFSHLFTYKIERETVATVVQPTEPRNNIVFIMDESIRSDHLSLNGYARPTTPYLEDLAKQGRLQNYGMAISATTRSLETLQLVLTGLTHEDLPDIEEKIEHYPTIFQYAKAMGYRTVYFDGQINNFWAGTPDDLKYVDAFFNVEHINPTREPGWDNDRKIGKLINEMIATSTGNFIFVFKHGNHTPYSENFPPNMAAWKPSSTEVSYDALASDREAFINTYDNAIKYNLDSFFRVLTSDHDPLPNNTVIIYTSDHGQTLNEDGERRSHAGRTLKEAEVPLFILGETGTKVDTGFRAEHANIFATLLDLMNYPPELRRHPYAVSLLKATASSSADRFFIVPNFVKKEKIRVPLQAGN